MGFQNATVGARTSPAPRPPPRACTTAPPRPSQRHARGGAADSSSSPTPSAVIRSIIHPVKSSNRRSSAREVVRYLTVLTSLVTLSTSAPSLPRYFQLCRVRDGWARKMARAASANSSQVVAYGMAGHGAGGSDRPRPASNSTHKAGWSR
eukprot:TRINITY_DN1956_c0_g1_i3.p1 TRINITY_DN1956_c0_g1~~TRINITY_DN1956_c0_g1_i3.p1  ORF type:complete len:150 (-),score=14.10 TRINITY_DN1956_c0_g1_i3:163-612(-)